MKPLVIAISLIFVFIIGSFALTFVNPVGMATRIRPTSISPACVDSDALNFLQKGFVNLNGTINEDYCQGNKLIEATCKGIIPNYVQKNCEELGPYECNKGRCIESKYVVAVRSDSKFNSVAEYFAQGKKAKLIKYTTTNDLIKSLVKSPPTYLAVVASPEELTPDFLFDLDQKLRRVDSDDFLDVAYGVITSFNEAEAYDYVNKILNYKVSSSSVYYFRDPSPSIYYPFPSEEISQELVQYQLKVTYGCINVDTPFSVACAPEEIHHMDKIVNLSSTHQILWFNVHGNPDTLYFDGEEKIVGNVSGAIGLKFIGPGVECWCGNGQNIGTFNSPDGNSPTEADQICINLTGSANGMTCVGKGLLQEIPFKSNASLVYAQSCITARINGIPTNPLPELDPILSTGNNAIVGQINNSLVLSFLKSGAQSYIGTNVLANSGFMPSLQILNYALLQGESLGETLMNFKNENILRTKLVPEEEKFTKDLSQVQTKSWVLFGDPQQKISLRHEKINDCVKSIIKTSENKYKITVFFNSSSLNNNMEVISKIEPSGDSFGQLSYSACLVKIPKQKNQTVMINGLTIPEGYSPLNQNNYHWNLGEEEYILYPQTISNQDYTFQVEIS
ncbi:MAG: hypothetical protein WCV90_02440 [Candidatus Woesearchaeota archaeon]|jgi:hypothetical protein